MIASYEERQSLEGWVTLYTKPHQERYVTQFLDAVGVETYLPAIHVYSTHTRRREEQPFFPCYLFAHIDPLRSAFGAFAWTPGLRHVVRFEDRLAWVSSDLICQMRDHLAGLDAAGYFDGHSTFKTGERVRITAGPLKDLEAVFDRVLGKQGRIRVLLDFLGRSVPCEVEAIHLARLDSAPR